MRVNCHAHVFNLDSVLSKGTRDIIRHRVVEAVAGEGVDDGKLKARLAKKVGEAITRQLASHPPLDEEAFVRDLLGDTGLADEIQKHTSGLPGPLSGLLADQFQNQAILGLRSLVARLTGILRREQAIRKASLTNRIDLLLIAFQAELESVADRLLGQIDPEAGSVALFLDIAASKGSLDDRREDQKLCLQHRADTVAAVMRNPGRLFPFIGIHTDRKGSPNDPGLMSFHDLAVDSIENWGFVGVKLYPALGYSPADPALDSIYQYCVDHEVPVMTHASGGGFFASEAARKFSHPKHFLKVLSKFPDLKLCLAHFGGSSGVQRLNLVRSKRQSNFGDTILSLMDDHPNVFTDVSFHEDPMKSDEAEAAYFEKLKALLEHSRYRDRILFGTDYWVIRSRATEADYWRYFEHMLTQSEFDRITEQNPARYLGLPNAAGAGASEPMSNHIDFLVDNLDVVKASKGKPPEWLLAAVGPRDTGALASLEAIRAKTEPSPRLLVKGWNKALDGLIDKTLATDARRLNPAGGWPIAGASFNLGGLDLALRANAKAAVGVDLFNHRNPGDPEGVLEGVLGVRRTGSKPSFEHQSWLKYGLEGSLRLAGQNEFSPGKLGLGFEAGASVKLADYRAHARNEPSTREAVVSDLRRPRFAFSRSDVLRLGVDDAVSLQVSGTLGASVGLSWASVLAGNLNRLGSELGLDAPLDIEVGLSASVTAGLSVTDDFRVVFARPRKNPSRRPFRVEVRKADSRGRKVGVEVGAGVRFANPQVVEQALGQMLGEKLQAVDRMLGKAASKLTPTEQKMRNRLVEKLGLDTKALSAIKAKRDELAQKAALALKAVANTEAQIGFSFEYSQLETDSVLLQANLSAQALAELHSDLVRGDLSVLLERADHEPVEMELVEFLREGRLVREKTWGFFFGFLGGAGSAENFERTEFFEQVRTNGKKRQTFTGLRGYEVKNKKDASWSGWKYSGELAAKMPKFETKPDTRDFRYALDLCFEWQKPLSGKLRSEISDAAMLWQAVEDPGTVIGALEPLGSKAPRVELRLRVRHSALVQLLPVALGDLATFAAQALAAGMPFRKDAARSSVAMRQAVYGQLWADYLASEGRNTNRRKNVQKAQERLRRDGPFLGVSLKSSVKLEESLPRSFTFAGIVELNSKLFRELKRVDRGLEALARAAVPGGLGTVGGEDPETIEDIFDDLRQSWEDCLQMRAFGRFLVLAANRIVGGASLIESSLAIEHGGAVRLLGAARPETNEPPQPFIQ